ncbi:hypothetical protein EGI11_04430 [Chryseobacterium sp. H3056]|uniref:Uncharacterized protein n=1 Tax=Kaistella daneshvariae TaxID=2487074 RepID=A0A3N0WY22_9FLAO|nr:hypothetical protein EGI11_04430 [Kaistella daneshvariae]
MFFQEPETCYPLILLTPGLSRRLLRGNRSYQGYFLAAVKAYFINRVVFLCPLCLKNLLLKSYFFASSFVSFVHFVVKKFPVSQKFLWFSSRCSLWFKNQPIFVYR